MICENDNLSYYLELLKNAGYKYIIKAQDKFLSGWGKSQNRKHIQLIAATTSEEATIISRDLLNDKSMSYVNWWNIQSTNNIKQSVRNKTYTIRNDWTRINNQLSKTTLQNQINSKNKMNKLIKNNEEMK